MGRRTSVNAAAIARRSIIQNAAHRRKLETRDKSEVDIERIRAAEAKRARKAK